MKMEREWYIEKKNHKNHEKQKNEIERKTSHIAPTSQFDGEVKRW